MASGGARANSGPPPDPNALRRDRKSDAAGWTTLPNEGRKGRVPAWPLPTSTPRERNVWKELWTKPQAVMWERNGQHHEVALYVRRLVESEAPATPVALGTLVKQLQESLGLSQPGMLRLRWRIAPNEVGDQRSQRPARAGAARNGRASARDRLAAL
jgi:hypothetical protein